ncbi:hypothetical protein Drorol1_Dr00005183 [Drosera rotundifolia]
MKGYRSTSAESRRLWPDVTEIPTLSIFLCRSHPRRLPLRIFCIPAGDKEVRETRAATRRDLRVVVTLPSRPRAESSSLPSSEEESVRAAASFRADPRSAARDRRIH